jgi:hypothetical protein
MKPAARLIANGGPARTGIEGTVSTAILGE